MSLCQRYFVPEIDNTAFVSDYALLARLGATFDLLFIEHLAGLDDAQSPFEIKALAGVVGGAGIEPATFSV